MFKDRKSLVLLGSLILWASAVLPANSARAEKIGVASAVSPTVTGTPPGRRQRVLAVGLNVQRNERVITTKVGRAQLLFLDGTALTLGPNSKVILDRFVYNPQRGTGAIALNLARGALRLVGGKISKVNPIQIQTPVATVGIRGGISVIFYEPGEPLKALFLFGKDMSVTANGVIESALRPGSIITVGSNGKPSPAQLASLHDVTVLLAPLLASSSKDSSTSFVDQVNNAANRTNDAANDTNAPPIGGSPANSTNEADLNNNQNTSRLDQNTNYLAANSAQREASQGIRTGSNESSSPGAIAGGEIRAPGYDQASFNSGTESADRDSATNTTVQSDSIANGRLEFGFTNGDTATLPYAAGSALLLDGANNSNNFSGPIVGGGVVTADRSFFFYNGLLSPSASKPIAIFGGTMTPSASFPTTGFAAYVVGDAFNSVPFYPIVDYDATTDTSPENIANLAQNATVSSLFSVFNSNMTVHQQSAFGGGPAQLQVSLGIEGQGTSQTSFLVGEVGGFITQSDSKGVALGGAIRGLYQEDASSAPYFIAGNAASAEVAGSGGVVGNAIFGANAEDMVLVPDQVAPNSDASAVQRTAGAIGSGNINQLAASSVTSNYAVVEASQTTTPPGLGASRTSLTLQGYAGSIMSSKSSTGSSSEILTNTLGLPSDVSITTDSATNRLQATFSLSSAPNSIPQPSVTLDFGNFPGDVQTTSAFVDNSIFAARETAAPASLTSVTVVDNGSLVNSPVSAHLLMVSADTVPLNASDAFLPSDVALCTCAFLNWGYWEGTIQHTAAGDPESGTVSGIPLATWVAGTVANPANLPPTGQATYNGHIIGNVDFGGNAYLAAGSFQNQWNFASRSGLITIDKFDNTNFSGTASSPPNSANFSGSFSGTKTGAGTLSGTLNGSFFKSASDVARRAPAGMGGAFAITGSSYKAAGTFAAQKTP